MQLGARRVFRLSLTTSVSLAVAYALPLQMPYIAPLFAFMLTAAPQPPMGLKGLVGLLLAVGIMLGSGLVLIPILDHYPATGLLLALLGLFLANYITLNLGKAAVGMLLTMGITLISMIGMLSYGLAVMLVQELLICVAIGVLAQWLVYPLFPEDPGPVTPPPAPPKHAHARWLAGRATLIVFPVFLLGLTNPTFYAPTILKTVALGQQASEIDARVAGRELLGSTFLAGVLAILFWFCLKLSPNLWFFFLWTLAFSTFIVARLYAVAATRFSPTFWQNVLITLLILVGPAVADSANGKDVYKAFFIRMSLYVAVTVYAWLALVALERWRTRRLHTTIPNVHAEAL
ncbi:MAG: hypothetical protein Hals2KO_12550 [Halioglobus sp.]